MTQQLKKLPADVFDFLELSALEFGGIGRGEYEDGQGYPLCIYGHAGRGILWFNPYTLSCENTDEIIQALRAISVETADNDLAVYKIQDRLYNGQNVRVLFADWCQELNIVRGK